MYNYVYNLIMYLKQIIFSKERHFHDRSYRPHSSGGVSFESLLVLPLQNNNHRQPKFINTRCP